MNGFKRASRRQAAVVGLAVLMGASFLGCHTGPRLFSKKDRDERTVKKELAEKDKGKFINRKKVRPESDYRRDDASDERVAKGDSKSKAKPSDALRKPSSSDADRAVATRKAFDDTTAESSRSSKTSTAQSKTAKPAEQRAEIARRDTSKRPVTDLLDDPLFDEKLPETRTSAKGTAATKPAAKSTTTAKANSANDDPFKNSVIGPSIAKRPNNNVAAVNFDDDDETDEEAEELEEMRTQAARKSLVKTGSAAQSLERRVAPTASPSQQRQKFLEDSDDQSAESFTNSLREKAPQVTKAEETVRSGAQATKRMADSAKTLAGQQVIDRRQSVQQKLNDWRREMDRDESLTDDDEEVVAAAPRTAARSSNTQLSKGHISQTSIEEFTPPAKSQGAVLNGELIIDTTTLPSRFQRNSSGSNNSNSVPGRMTSNSSANIDIVPGATTNRARPAGQISLQSLSEEENSSGLTTAGYEQAGASDDLGSLPSLKLDSGSGNGPNLMAMEGDAKVAPTPPEAAADNSAGIGSGELSSGTPGWKRALLVLGAMVSAVAIGFGLRRRMELTPQPIRIPKLPDDPPQEHTAWPRG